MRNQQKQLNHQLPSHLGPFSVRANSLANQLAPRLTGFQSRTVTEGYMACVSGSPPSSLHDSVSASAVRYGSFMGPLD